MTEHDRTTDGGPAAPMPRSPAPGKWGVAGKLWLGFGLLVLVLGVSGLVSYRSIQRIDRDLLRIVAVEEPLEQAVLEMEINAGESARAVLDYIRDLAPEHIEAMRDSEADFERYAADFEHLAETDEERRLGQEVAGLYGEFKALGDEIVALADRRRNALQQYRRQFNALDELLDEDLRGVINMTVPDGMQKLHVAYQMDELIDEAFPAIEIYIVHRDPALRQKFLDAEAYFKRLEGLYRENNLSADEKRLLNRIGESLAETVRIGLQVMAIADMLNERLDEFEELLKTIDAILDDEIQPLIHAETVEAADDAKISTDVAALFLVFLGLVGLCIAGTAVWALSRAILGPIRALVSGTEIVGGGDLEHRIDIGSGDEFSYLAAAFNRMVENLQRSGAALREAYGELEFRVQDRTRDIEEVNETLKLEITERKRAEEALREAHDTLEQRVQKRTFELQKTNADLQKEVSERTRAETALVESEQRFKDFAEATSDWFWEMDADLRFTYISERFFETFRVRPEDAIGKTRKEVAGEAQIAADPEKWQRHFDDLEAHRPIRDFDYPIAGDDGKRRYLSLSCVPVFDDAGNFRGYRGTDTDVTERKYMEEEFRQAQKMEAIGRLTSGVAHEFNNLLTAIGGFAHLLVRWAEDPEKVREWSQDIVSAADEAAMLTSQLLSFSRKQALEPEVVSIGQVIEKTESLIHSAVGGDISANYNVVFDIIDKHLHVKVDPGQLSQALLNIAINAYHAMCDGGTMTITTHQAELNQAAIAAFESARPGLYAAISVSDTGSGIDKETMAQMFEPFFTTKEPGEGTGLGLSMVYGMVQQSGGVITVDSEVGTGTTFTIYLPLTDPAEAVGHEDFGDPALASRGDETVLVAEDELAARQLTHIALETLGYTVLTANDGAAALELFEQHGEEIDLLITDLNMPGMTGRQLAHELVGKKPELKVVFITGFDPAEFAATGLRASDSPLFRKPFDPDELVHTVRRLLDESKDSSAA